MFISITDNGGRRVDGDRRQLSCKDGRSEKRSGAERRVAEADRRCADEKIERRAISILFEK